jgi:hypothetical protein
MLLLSPATRWLKKKSRLMRMLVILIAGILLSFQLFLYILEIFLSDKTMLCPQYCCKTHNNLAFKSESQSG